MKIVATSVELQAIADGLPGASSELIQSIADELLQLRRAVASALSSPSRPSMTLIEFRDELLESLRAQFKAKVAVVLYHGNDRQIEDFLRDLANNLAQPFADGLEVK
jgi:hypothetical protein